DQGLPLDHIARILRCDFLTVALIGKCIDEVTPKTGTNALLFTLHLILKKAERLLEKFWKLFKLLFPAYIRNVALNHALCSIKEVTERRTSNVLSSGINPSLARIMLR
ncbi:MAG: hypothetical protein P8Z37_19045, partial [Acidobacteriota bacterium]